MAYNVEKILHICLSRKKIQFYRQRFGRKKNSYPNQITHNPPPPPPASKVKWSVPNNPNETSHIPKQLLH